MELKNISLSCTPTQLRPSSLDWDLQTILWEPIHSRVCWLTELTPCTTWHGNRKSLLFLDCYLMTKRISQEKTYSSTTSIHTTEIVPARSFAFSLLARTLTLWLASLWVSNFSCPSGSRRLFWCTATLRIRISFQMVWFGKEIPILELIGAFSTTKKGTKLSWIKVVLSTLIATCLPLTTLSQAVMNSASPPSAIRTI